MTTKRPSTERRHTRTTTAKQDDGLDRGMAFNDPDDGVRLEVRVRDVKGTHDAALVEHTGMDFLGLLEALSKRQGLDLIGALVWFGRLVNGRAGKSYEDTLAEIGWKEVLDADLDEPGKEADRPEA